MRRKFFNKMQRMLPNKALRREKFSRRQKNKHRHEHGYHEYSYRQAKASRFNRWEDYKRLIDRPY